MIFPLIHKLAANFDAKSLSDPINFAKEYEFNLGQVSKDGTRNFPLIRNSLGSATNSDPIDDKIISGSFGIEIPVSELNNPIYFLKFSFVQNKIHFETL